MSSMTSGFNLPQTSFKTRASNCALLTISVICVCVLVVCGVMVVREYALGKAYELSTCQIMDIDYTNNEINCMFCGTGSKDKTKEKGAGACTPSQFPCLQVWVEYQADGKSNKGLMHTDSLQAIGAYAQCSFSVCLKKHSDNVLAVERYAMTWRKREGTTFKCYYNSKNKEDVIVEKRHTKEDVIHSMVWPCLVIVICGCIFLKLEMKRRNISFCGDGEHIRGEAEGAEDLKNAMLQDKKWHPSDQCKLNCQLMKCRDINAGLISSSLSSLDRIAKAEQQKQLASNGKLGTSISVDSMKHHIVNTVPSETNPIVTKYGPQLAHKKIIPPQDIEITVESPSGSQGSRIMGLETPV